MTRIVSLTSRTIGDPVRMLDVRCGDVRVVSRPDKVEHGAGGDVQRSIMPSILFLVDVDAADLRHLRGSSWTGASWHDEARGGRVEVALPGTDPQIVGVRRK